MLKGIIAAVPGFLLGTVGLDPMVSIPRFTFGFATLFNGINMMVLVIGRWFIPIFFLIARVPNSIIYPITTVLCTVGVYGFNSSFTDLWLMLIFGILAYFMRQFGYPLAPILIAFIIEPIGERATRQTLTLSRGQPVHFCQPTHITDIPDIDSDCRNYPHPNENPQRGGQSILDPTIINETEYLKDTITRFRRRLHSNPELAFKEYETAKAVMELLEGADIHTVSLAGTGVLGVLEGLGTGRDPLPVTALRADMGALPVTEKTGLKYSSQNPGIMHACGHDGNTAALAGAALILSRLRHKFSGTVKFIFQPGEESLQGAETMIRQGVLDNPKVERVFACHGWPALPTGKIGIFPGNYIAMAGKFSLSFSAPGAHGAYPHQGVDTVLAAAEAVQRINCIVSREVNALDQAVLSVCTINGGKAFNVMPSLVVLTGTFRCLDDNVADRLKESIRRVPKGICQTNNCEFELEFQGLVPALHNGDAGVKSVQQAARTFLPSHTLEMLEKPCMGSEDFVLYLSKVPEGAFIRIGVIPEGRSEPAPLHSDRFDYDDNALPRAMTLMAGIVMTHHGIDS